MDEVLLLTPVSKRDPHSNVYKKNYSAMLDLEGNMIEKQHITEILLSEVKYDSDMDEQFHVSKVEAKVVDSNFTSMDAIDPYFNMSGNLADPASIFSALAYKDLEN